MTSALDVQIIPRPNETLVEQIDRKIERLLKLRAAEIMQRKTLSYFAPFFESKGVFAGVSLDGSVMQADESGDKAMYGDVDRHQILNGKVAVPSSARPLLHEIGK